eukprot:9871460-Alexandrium_andersonii.AAC.1
MPIPLFPWGFLRGSLQTSPRSQPVPGGCPPSVPALIPHGLRGHGDAPRGWIHADARRHHQGIPTSTEWDGLLVVPGAQIPGARWFLLGLLPRRRLLGLLLLRACADPADGHRFLRLGPDA